MSIFNSIYYDRGVSIIEMLVTLSISAVLASFSVPSLATFYGQMQASDDLRKLTYTLSELRSEAVRMKINIRIAFNEQGYEWDIGDDGSIDGNKTLLPTSSWQNDTPPTDILFNGLGVVRGIGSETTVTISNRESERSCKINSNGYISI